MQIEFELICWQVAALQLEGREAFVWYLSNIPDGFRSWLAYNAFRHERRAGLTGPPPLPNRGAQTPLINK